MPATLAIIGRPNVGKSTLFNRFLRRRKAITHDRPGVTRDRLEGQAVLAGVPVNIIDTGGLTLEDPQGLEVDVLEQARRAVTSSDLVLLVVDGREGITSEDQRVAQLLRQSGKPVLVAVNKVDGGEKEDLFMADFHSLGLDLAPVSAEHGFGMRTLVDDIISRLPEVAEPEERMETELTLSMLGRPNAGKSSIINAMVGDYRMIVSDQAGTTRDAVDVTFEKDGKRFVFVDTAGVRRKAKIDDALERISSLTALGSGRRADVTILVVDGPEGLAMQDKRLISYLDKEKVPFLIVINKVDLVDAKGLAELKQAVSEELRICNHVPVIFTSAVKGKGLRDILPTAQAIRAECHIRIGTGELNRLLREALERHQPPLVKGKRPKFYYLTQTGTVPATFVFFVNDPERIKDSYARFLENQLRKLFGIRHAPVKLLFRGSRQRNEEGEIENRPRPKPQKPGKDKPYPSTYVKPAAPKAAVAKSGEAGADAGKSGSEKASGDRPDRDQSRGRKPAGEKSSGDRSDRDQSRARKPSAPRTGGSKAGGQKSGGSKTGGSKSGSQRSGSNRAGSSRSRSKG
ncbi:ribosome biogenesis GTPase Der [Fundidesulfovibrio putealis]|uniref:ribosome biogenesis GTPase Der n=1 Tax=Fundidesulfovibrio putealis TaxID=270496 RepID=UPI0004158E48|nr:ribosome biogenesis GTPase Der [Fundidesulfovibrio putealis]